MRLTRASTAKSFAAFLKAGLTEEPRDRKYDNWADYRAKNGEPQGDVSNYRTVCFHCRRKYRRPWDWCHRGPDPSAGNHGFLDDDLGEWPSPR